MIQAKSLDLRRQHRHEHFPEPSTNQITQGEKRDYITPTNKQDIEKKIACKNSGIIEKHYLNLIT
jgi:hypothetical protein